MVLQREGSSVPASLSVPIMIPLLAFAFAKSPSSVHPSHLFLFPFFPFLKELVTALLITSTVCLCVQENTTAGVEARSGVLVRWRWVVTLTLRCMMELGRPLFLKWSFRGFGLSLDVNSYFTHGLSMAYDMLKMIISVINSTECFV